ncbi:MAG: DUF4089 domain-containing protein [Burkholderiales bacterium]|nr:MAG: DUF4089 domain-containing protein [Burkholderiales bacterium]
MTDEEALNYVNTMAKAIDLPLDEVRAKNVAMHLGRTFGMVTALKQYPLAPEQELAEIFRPSPFPVVAGKEGA